MATLKPLREILNAIGLTMASYQQMRKEFHVPPLHKKTAPNPYGRGACYFFDEAEVLEAIRLYRASREKKVTDGHASASTMAELILNLLKARKTKKSEARDILGATKGEKLREFDRTFADLVNKGVIHQRNQFMEPGVYSIKDTTDVLPELPPGLLDDPASPGVPDP